MSRKVHKKQAYYSHFHQAVIVGHLCKHEHGTHIHSEDWDKVTCKYCLKFKDSELLKKGVDFERNRFISTERL